MPLSPTDIPSQATSAFAYSSRRHVKQSSSCQTTSKSILSDGANEYQEHKDYPLNSLPNFCTRQKYDQEGDDLPTPPSSPVDEQTFLNMALHSGNRIFVAKRDGNLKAVVNEYLAMKKQGVPLSLHTFQLVLEAHATLRREGTTLSGMIKVYDDMLQLGLNSTSDINVIMIRTLCKRDVEVQKTVAILKRQCARTGKNDCNIGSLESEANLTRALQIFRQTVASNEHQKFKIDMYNQILRVLSHYGDAAEALYIYDQLQSSTTEMPNSATFAALINLFGRAGDIDAVHSYFSLYLKLKDSMGPHDSSYVYNALVDSHLKCDQIDSALRVLEEDIINDGVKLTIIPYNSVIRHYCNQQQPDSAEALLKQLRSNPSVLPTPDASSYGPILAAYCQMDDYENATKMYNELLTTDISKSYGNLANYALLCLSHSQHQKALSVVDDMRAIQLEPETVLTERIVICLVQAGDIVEAIKTLQAAMSSISRRNNFKGINSLSEAANQIVLGAQSNIQHVFEVAEIMQSANLGHGTLSPLVAKALLEGYLEKASPTALTLENFVLLYDAVITAHGVTITGHSLTTNHLFLTLYEDMQKFGIAPDTRLYRRILSHLQLCGDTEMAYQWKQIFRPDLAEEETRLTDKAATESKEIMNAVIDGDVDSAIQKVASLVNKGMVPLAESMRDAIALAGKQGHIDAAISMYQKTKHAYENLVMDEQRRNQALFMVTNSMLIGYAQQGDMASAKKYYDLIKQMDRLPDGNGYASLLIGTAKCATDEATDALIIYDEAKRHHVKPTTFFFNVVISKLAKARKLEPALRLFEEMKQAKITPNAITYGAVISASVRAGSESNARRLFEEMLMSPTYQPRVGPFNNMMQFYIRQQPNREQVLKYYAEMRRRHIKPSGHTYKLLMEAYSSMVPYDMPTAHRMLTDMDRRDGIRPQATHYATLIYAYGTLQCDIQSAERVFADMSKHKVQPDEGVYQAMLDTFISNDALVQAERLYRKMLVTIERSHSPYIENLLIRGYGQSGMLEKAEKVFKAMSNDKIHVQGRRNMVVREPSTFEAMIRACLDNQRPKKAKEVLEQMIQRDFPEKVVAHVASLIVQ